MPRGEFRKLAIFGRQISPKITPHQPPVPAKAVIKGGITESAIFCSGHRHRPAKALRSSNGYARGGAEFMVVWTIMPLEFLISALVTLLIVVDPIGLVPSYLAV